MMNKLLAPQKLSAFREPIPSLLLERMAITSPQENHSDARDDTVSAKARNMLTDELAAYYLKTKAGSDPDDVLDDWF